VSPEKRLKNDCAFIT